jgi:LmbE family N-acetylglucosaminyl deacetylase
VAHPDDETLWAGGTMLSHPSWNWFVVCLCRGFDSDRAPKFNQALKVLGSDGIMGDLDDGPEQITLDDKEVEKVILNLLPSGQFDLIITHNPSGEYTRNLRHEETGKAVIRLWHGGRISARELWTFAYEDGGKKYHPGPIENAPGYFVLAAGTWLEKYALITRTYGFGEDSWEAKTTPRGESFWRFTNSNEAIAWIEKVGIRHEGSGLI